MYVTRLPTTIYAFLMRYTLHIVFMTCKGGRRRQTQNGRNWVFSFPFRFLSYSISANKTSKLHYFQHNISYSFATFICIKKSGYWSAGLGWIESSPHQLTFFLTVQNTMQSIHIFYFRFNFVSLITFC